MSDKQQIKKLQRERWKAPSGHRYIVKGVTVFNPGFEAWMAPNVPKGPVVETIPPGNERHRPADFPYPYIYRLTYDRQLTEHEAKGLIYQGWHDAE